MKCTCTTDLDELRSTIEIKTCSLCKAAPDLLEACKLALSDFQEYFEHITSVAGTIGQLKKAITKAEGGLND